MIGPIVTTIGSLVIGIGSLITSVGAIMAAVAPLAPAFAAVAGVISGPVVLAIGAFVVAAAAIIANWDKIKAAVSAAVETIKATVTTTFTNIKTNVLATVENIRATVTTKFNQVKTAITQPIETAKKTVTEAINKIKNVINNAKLQLPKFKLPHFVINGGKLPWGIGGQGVKPTISVSWYRKAYDNPILFTTPTVLPTLGGLKGFGDGSGAEIVMSLEKLREVVGASGGDTINIVVNAAPGMNVSQLADEVQRRLAQAQLRRDSVYA